MTQEGALEPKPESCLDQPLTRKGSGKPFTSEIIIQGNTKLYKEERGWGFPGGPVVKTLPANAAGCGFDPWLGTKILHAAQGGQKLKKKKRKEKKL